MTLKLKKTVFKTGLIKKCIFTQWRHKNLNLCNPKTGQLQYLRIRVSLSLRFGCFEHTVPNLICQLLPVGVTFPERSLEKSVESLKSITEIPKEPVSLQCSRFHPVLK